MFFASKKNKITNQTANNVIVPMDDSRLRRISSMSVDDAQRDYDEIIQLSSDREVVLIGKVKLS